MEASREDSHRDATGVVRVIDRGEGVFALRVDDAAGGQRLRPALARAIADALGGLATVEGLRALVIEGAADVFLSGDRSDLDAAFAAGLQHALLDVPVSVIASVQSDALGAGFLFASLCDHMVFNADAACGFTQIDDGLLPDAAEAALFTARFGAVQARDLLQRLPVATARERVARGWTCPVEAADTVTDRAYALAAALAEQAGQAQALLRDQRRARWSEALQRMVEAAAHRAPAGTHADEAPLSAPLQTVVGLEVEHPIPGVLLVRPVAEGDAAATRTVAALESLFASLREATHGVRALVIASAHPSVLPAGDEAELLPAAQRLQALAREAPVPVVVALPASVDARGWTIGQCFDAAIHADVGHYGTADLVDTAPAWTALAANAFAARLGVDAAREIVLGNGAWSGETLKARFPLLDVVPADRVEPEALALASAWAAWPQGALVALRGDMVPLGAFEAMTGDASALAAAKPLVSTSPVVDVSRDEAGVVTVRMRDADAKNLFTPALVQGLDEVFAQIAADPGSKVVVLAGLERFFATGGTRESLHAIQSGRARFTDAPVFVSALRCPVPVVACMQGHAVGGGLSLGLFADIALFGAESQYLNPYLRYGFTPGGGATLIVPEALGLDLGQETLSTAREYAGSDLLARNRALRVHPRAELLERATALAHRIARHPRATLVALKACFNRPVLDRLDAVFQQEVAMHERSFVGRSEALERIHAHFGPDAVATPSDASPSTNEHAMTHAAPSAEPAAPPSRDEITRLLRTLLAQELHVQEDEIGETVPFVDLGLDSITGVTWVRKINARFATDVPATRVYSHPTLAAMTDHVLELLPEIATASSPDVAEPAVATSPAMPTPAPMPAQRIPFSPAASGTPTPTDWSRLFASRGKLASWRDADVAAAGPGQSQAASGQRAATEAVAIIGMAGRFPQAPDIDAYWDNLAAGRLCVEEVPRERWDMDAYYQAGDPAPGKVNAKWMGCLPEHDHFDPLFFDISPKEAMSMDPQQRVFLQTCWHAIEHAGYNPRALSGSRCGVFVGCGPGDYHLLSSDLQSSALGFTGNDTSILAGRVSYFLNLQGPSLAIETACSSSLVAIATACDHLTSGSCDAAIAGGVGVIATPHLLVKMSQTGMLSPDGRCFTFDQRANGFVPGEAVGALLMKRLSDAERDGDTILGVIQGWGLNQDGRTNGITAPNPDAQARLQQDVHARFGIDPAGIQLVEAHGTGTKLGDPIEVEALKRAFGPAREAGSCALGSVKSNIGHCFTAAGVASVIKVVLSLQHAQLAPTINFDRLNEHIDLRGSPFYVNDRLRDWAVPANGCRRAAISGFGFGGTNAHLIISEYAGRAAARASDALRRHGKLPIVLSARTVEQLDDQARQLLALIERKGAALPLDRLAYTLQVGREAMDERLGVMAGSLDELAAALRAHLAGGQGNGVFRGAARDHRKTMALLFGDIGMRDLVVDRLVAQGQWARLLELWTQGFAIEWNRLYGETLPQRIGLPGYPFAKQRYWIEASAPVESGGTARLHPLLHRNVSTLRRHVYASTFQGNEPFLAESEGRALPASAMLEMARAAVAQAWDGDACVGWRLTDIAWGEACIPNEGPLALTIALSPETEDTVAFEIASGTGDDECIHCQGLVQAVVDAGQALAAVPSGRAITVELPDLGLATSDIALHPWLLETVVRAIAPEAAAAQPGSLDALWVSAPCRGTLTAWADWQVEAEGDAVLSVSLLDADQHPCAHWRGLRLSTSTEAASIEVPVTAASAAASALPTVAPVAPRLTRTELLRGLRESLAKALYLQPGDIANDKPFIELGLDSIVGVEWINELNKLYGIKLVAARLYDYPCLDDLSAHLEAELAKLAPPMPTAMPVPAVAKPTTVLVPVSTPVAAAVPRLTRVELLRGLRESLAKALYLQPSDIANDKPFIELGLDSIVGVEWINELNKLYGIKLVAARLYDYPNLDDLSGHLEAELAKLAPTAAPAVPSEQVATAAVADGSRVVRMTARRRLQRRATAKPVKTSATGTVPKASGRIAVVGMSGRYPQAPDLTQFWTNLAEGRNSITEVPPSRWDVDKYYDPDPRKEDAIYCKWIGMLDDIESFDPLFFRISPAEAKNMDPQHRMFLEEGYRAFEHAGYARQTLGNSKCGVYVGIIGSEYSSLVSNAVDITGTNPAIGAARIAYFLNLKGPAIAIDTACSASLVAMHLACQGLLSHETDMALAGGVSIYLHPDTYMGMCRAGMLSPDGQCRTFDDRANGFVPGEGVGAVVLKRLEDAERDGDTIYGVIVGSGINQDGKTNGITAPSVNSQIELERSLYAAHDIHPESITYVETHGTGTKLGDPIELEALATVFREKTEAKHFCALGSVKSNIGHASGAAGVASVHKVLLSLQHRTLVPSLNVTKENTLFDFADSPFYVSRTTRPWDSPAGVPRRAAVSSFGFSGTNAHLVIEEYVAPVRTASHAPATPLPVLLSARTADQLRRRARDLLDHVAAHPDVSLASLAYTLMEGREALDERLAVVAGSLDALETGLRTYLDGGHASGCFAGRVQRDEDGLPRGGTVPRTSAGSPVDAAELAQAWVRGDTLSWSVLGNNAPVQRIALPTYPFATKRYWVDPSVTPASSRPAATAPATASPPTAVPSAPAAPSMARDERIYRIDMVHLASYLQAGDGAVPAAALLEALRDALASASGDEAMPILGDVVWGLPLVPSADRDVFVTLFPQAANRWAFEVHSVARGGQGGTGEQVHCQGQAIAVDAPSLPRLDPAALRAGLAVATRVDDARIEQALRGPRELLLHLRAETRDPRPADIRIDRIDAALRAVSLLVGNDAAARQACAVPDAVATLCDAAIVPPTDWRWVSIRAITGEGSPLAVDIDVCDDSGTVGLRIEGVTFDRLALSAPAEPPPVTVAVTLASVEATTPAATTATGRPRIALAEMQ